MDRLTILLTIIIVLLIVIAIGLFIQNGRLKQQLNSNIIKSAPRSNTDPKLLEKYQNILDNSPRYEDYMGRSYKGQRYDDSYDTGTDFKLREILLLIW